MQINLDPQPHTLSFQPFPIAAAIVPVVISVEVYTLADLYMEVCINSRRFLALNTGQFVSHFSIGQLRAICHFVRSPRRLLSALLLAATAPHKIGPVLSLQHALPVAAPEPLCGVALSSHTGQEPQNLVALLCAACGVACFLCLRRP